MVCIGFDNGNDVVVVNLLNIGPLPYFGIDE
jgi:hypothetical protein